MSIEPPLLATSSPGGLPPDLPRPVAVTVFGILNIVFGAIGLLGTAASSVMFFVEFPAEQVAANPTLGLMQSDATYRLILQTLLVAGTVASIAGIVGGIGLLKGQSWGRTISIGYGWYCILSCFIGLGINWVYLFQPMLATAAEGTQAQKVAVIGGIVGGLFGTCFGGIYPVVLVIFMMKRSVREYFETVRAT